MSLGSQVHLSACFVASGSQSGCWTSAPHTLIQTEKERKGKITGLSQHPVPLYQQGNSSPGSYPQQSSGTHGQPKQQGCLGRHIFSSGFTNILINVRVQMGSDESIKQTICSVCPVDHENQKKKKKNSAGQLSFKTNPKTSKQLKQIHCSCLTLKLFQVDG